MKFLNVVNRKGENEPFSFRKVYRSARRVGASKDLSQKIAETIEKQAYSGIETSEIFKKVKKLLKQEVPKAALRFNLKEGMKKLGPTGFPFEKYIGEIFSRNNFKVKFSQYIRGFCCKYEIDFLAKNGNLLYLGECKYRNLPKGKVHSNVALSNYARFLDIKKGAVFPKKVKVKSLLVTNRRFTSKAIKYSKCVGVELLGWNCPKGKGLEYLIDSQKLYPITILPSLKNYLAEIFVSKGIILVQNILETDIRELARKTGVSKKDLKPLIKEAEILLEK